MKKIPLTQGKFALVDDADFWHLSAFKWHFCGGYARMCLPRKGVKQQFVLMHHIILRRKKGKLTDHINFDKLDNRRANLRHVTYSESNRHRRPWKKAS